MAIDEAPAPNRIGGATRPRRYVYSCMPTYSPRGTRCRRILGVGRLPSCSPWSCYGYSAGGETEVSTFALTAVSWYSSLSPPSSLQGYDPAMQTPRIVFEWDMRPADLWEGKTHPNLGRRRRGPAPDLYQSL